MVGQVKARAVEGRVDLAFHIFVSLVSRLLALNPSALGKVLPASG